MANMPELVDYAYIAEKLNVTPQTVRVYATAKGSQRKEGFPKSVAPETSRSPLFIKEEADAFIAQRIAESKAPSRLNANRPESAPRKATTHRKGATEAAVAAAAERRASKPKK
ncbi:hypothetical protein ACF044_16025 [Microbacterium sp. NPDC016588]|uniref:hypothetical protein n=1 Tax=Microbacterium TaxID=33882 RepID=UPI0007F4BEA9|nr:MULTISPECIES: hypothetical protein [unclassified Microbacterium]OAN37046.1 hypothetical protein A4X16_16915 [Microbacterium sp. H83]TCJ21475.1 hypothetical protein E0W80_16435 [Microbacterium sp. PI-1]